MHETGTHVIDIQISENTIIIYSNDIKITWNQVTISLCALGSTSRLAQQFETLPINVETGSLLLTRMAH